MAKKYFRADLEPLKRHTQETGVEAFFHVSEDYSTQKEYSDALEEMLVSEGQDLKNWKKPKITKIDEETFEKLNAELEDMYEDAEEGIDHNVEAEASEEDFDFNAEDFDFDNEAPQGEGVTDAQEDAEAFDFDEDFTFDEDGVAVDAESGEVAVTGSVYRYFEFEKGYAGMLITTPVEGGKFKASYIYLKQRPLVTHELDRTFATELNAASNVLAAYINHLTDIKNTVEAQGSTVGEWYNKTISGLSSNGDKRFIESIISEEEAGVLINQVEITEQTDGARKSSPKQDESPKSEDVEDSNIYPLIDAIRAHKEFGKMPESKRAVFIKKVGANLAEIFGDADEQAIAQGVETIECLHKIGHLAVPEDCAEAFYIITDEEVTQPGEEDFEEDFEFVADFDEDELEGEPVKLSVQFIKTFDAITGVCDAWNAKFPEKDVAPKRAFEEFMQAVDIEKADDERMARAISKAVKNPHVFVTPSTATQLSMKLGYQLTAEPSQNSDAKATMSRLKDVFEKHEQPQAEADKTDSEAFDEVIGDASPAAKKYAEEAGKKVEQASEEIEQASGKAPAKSALRRKIKANSEKAKDNASEAPSSNDSASNEMSDSDFFMTAFDTPAVSSVNESLESYEDEGDDFYLPTVDEAKAEFDRKVAEVNAKISELKPGERIIFDDLDNDVYHASEGVSSTALKVARESLMKFNAKFVAKTIPKEEIAPDHFKVGNLFHTLTLEPHKLHDEYFALPEDYKAPTAPQFKKYDSWVKAGKPDDAKAGKEYPTDLMLELCSRHYALMREANGRIVISHEGFEKARNMANAVREDKDTFNIANNAHLKAERSYYMRDEATGLIVKCRPDLEIGAVIGDLKSIALRSSPDEDYLITALRKEVFSRGYHISAAMYLEITGAKQWFWIFANKEEGYHWSAPIRATEETLNKGFIEYRSYLEKIAEGYRTGIWPKPASIQTHIENGKPVLAAI